MPRDGSGIYTLPTGNPVVTNTVIQSTWANTTMADIAAQLNNVFTRDGLLGPTAPFKIVDGTVAAPGIAFNSEPSLGIYRPSLNTIAVAVAGEEVTRGTATGLQVSKTLRVGNGAPTAPAYSFNNDPDTGLYSAGDGVVVLVLNGVEVMRWSNAGGVPTVTNTVPVGTMLDFAGNAIPAGYLDCDGSAVSRTTYANLYAALGGAGSPWGQGDGSTTFNVPPPRRVNVGAGGAASGLLGNTVGALGGAETVALDANTLPAHNHVINIGDPGHAHGVSDPGHSHQYSNAGAGQGQPPQANANTNTGGTSNTSHVGTGIAIAAAGTGITASSNNAGAGAAHSNLQPSMVVRRIIKF